MALTKIEWTSSPRQDGTLAPGYTFNPWEGCQKVSQGCENCYAEERDKRFHGGEHWGPDGKRKMHSDAYWRQPLKWNKAAEQAGERHRVFCASLADVFEDRPELREPRIRLYKLIDQTPNLDWLLLTKRPENVEFLQAHKWDALGWPQNVWLGTSVENQEHADKRIPELLKVPAAVRFLSCEPLLSAVDLSKWLLGGSQVDNQRDGNLGATSDRCAVCGQARPDLAAQGNNSRLGDSGQRNPVRAETCGRGAFKQGRLSQGSGDNRQDSLYSASASDRLDGGQSADHSDRVRNQPQGRREGQQSARQFGTSDTFRKFDSFPAQARELSKPEGDRGQAYAGAGGRDTEVKRQEDHAACSNCGSVWSEYGDGSQYRHSHQVEMDSRHLIDWVIVGGESGPNARPIDPNWVRELQFDCTTAGVAFFFKQWGEYAPTPEYRDGKVFMNRVGKKAAGRLLDGREWNEFPKGAK